MPPPPLQRERTSPSENARNRSESNRRGCQIVCLAPRNTHGTAAKTRRAWRAQKLTLRRSPVQFLAFKMVSRTGDPIRQVELHRAPYELSSGSSSAQLSPLTSPAGDIYIYIYNTHALGSVIGTHLGGFRVNNRDAAGSITGTDHLLVNKNSGFRGFS